MKKYLIQTFGCQMNVHDSRRIEEVLHADGYQATEDAADADLILFNTCSVREKAEHKLMSALGKMRPYKEENPALVIGVAGCVAQQEGEGLLKKARFIDVVIGPDNIPELPSLVEHVATGGPPLARTVFDLEDPAFLHATPLASKREISAFVTVMKGCDERCTYCIVPTTRGPERYRSADDIVQEISNLVAGGVREVTLLGQTVNSWYDPREPAVRGRASQFANLLRRIAHEVPDLWRLRYTSPHPRHLTDALIAAHADLDVLVDHLHLPVQSGSDRVLRRMLRRYSREEYLTRTAKLKTACPDLTLSTDIIVGFPGETDAQFEETLSLVREAGFVAAFGFKYSPRPFTPALRLGDDIPMTIKDERLQALFAQVEVQQQAHLSAQVGTRTKVLIEGRSKDGVRFGGRSHRNEIVHVLGPEGVDLRFQLVDVCIEEANKHSLMGRIDGPVDMSRRWEPQVSGAPKKKRSLPLIGASGSA